MRRSAPTSVAIGTTLDVGASVMKNQAPRNPSFGLKTNPMTVNTRRHTIYRAHGATFAERQQARKSIVNSTSSRGQTV